MSKSLHVDCALARFNEPVAWCSDIIDRAQALEPYDAEAGGTAAPELRRSKIRWLLPDNGFADVIELVAQRVRAVADDYGIMLNPIPIHEVQFTTYMEGCFYDTHIDDWYEPRRNTFRKLSMTILLNSMFIGGQFQFPTLPVEMEAGDGIVFPSMTHHKVCRVDSGMRFSLVAWAEGPQWR